MKITISTPKSSWEDTTAFMHFENPLQLSPKFAVDRTLEILQKLQNKEVSGEFSKEDSLWLINYLNSLSFVDFAVSTPHNQISLSYIVASKPTEYDVPAIQTFLQGICKILEITEHDLYAFIAFNTFERIFSRGYQIIGTRDQLFDFSQKPSLVSYLKIASIMLSYAEHMDSYNKTKRGEGIYHKDFSEDKINAKICKSQNMAADAYYPMMARYLSAADVSQVIENIYDNAITLVHGPFLPNVVNRQFVEEVNEKQLLEFSKMLIPLNITSSACEYFDKTFFSYDRLHYLHADIIETLHQQGNIREYAEAVMKHFFVNNRRTARINPWNSLTQLYQYSSTAVKINTQEFVSWMIENNIPSNTKTLILVKKFHKLFDSILGFNYYFTKYYFAEGNSRGAKNLKSIEWLAKERGEVLE